MNTKNNTYFYAILGSFFVGIIFSSFIFVEYKILVYPILFFVVIGGLFRFRHSKDIGKVLRVIILVAFFIFGFLHNQYYVSKKVGELESLVGKEVELIGVIVDEPDIRDFNTRLTFKPNDLKKTKIILKTTPYPEYKYGDKVELLVY